MEAIEFLKQHRVYEDETIYNSVGEMVGSLSQLMEEFAALRQPPVMGSFSLSELWKMAQKYNCDDFVKMLKEVNRLNDL